MKELDFEFFTNVDAGRAFYRGLFIYAGLYCFRHYSVIYSYDSINIVRSVINLLGAYDLFRMSYGKVVIAMFKWVRD